MSLLLGLVSCGAEPKWSEQSEIDRVVTRAPGPATLSLVTVINNKSGAGAHSALVINASQRVVWDPAGTWWNPNAPERNDLHFGITDKMLGIYIDYHTRESFDTVVQKLEVSAEVAARAFALASAYGAVPKTQCAVSTGRILRQLPDFAEIPAGYSPKRLMQAFGALPNVETRRFEDIDADDNSGLLPQN
ncbi:MAG: hypothetical protein OXC60_12775 [Litoreibacter sp.]|nr:hypothetical protein [Litoreibacter sp.]MCY4335528.1 hypothetical protein [Litoreibacter sp.]